MDFLGRMDTIYIKLGLLIVFLIGHFIVARQHNLRWTLQYYLYSYGIMILLFSISIPHVFSGYPYDISDLENKKRLLYHLQRNNEAIVKTTEAIRDMVFITFIMLISSISNIVKYLKIGKSVG